MRRQGELSPVVESDFIILSPGDEVGLNVIVIIGLWLLYDSSSLVAQIDINISSHYSSGHSVPPLAAAIVVWIWIIHIETETLTQLHNLLTKILMGLLMIMLTYIYITSTEIYSSLNNICNILMYIYIGE